jgi:hypothetical protein
MAKTSAERQRDYRLRHPERVKIQNNSEKAKARKKRWREKNPDHDRQYRLNNLERIRAYDRTEKRLRPKRAYSRSYYHANAEKLKGDCRRRNMTARAKALRKLRYLRNREKNIHRSREFYRAHCEEISIRNAAHFQKNRERIYAYRRAFFDKFPYTKLSVAYRAYISGKLKRYKVKKAYKTTKLLGCDMHWLVAWLEVQFRPGMTWENYGPAWHIDHIKPCKKFDLSDPRQQRLCFHWTNLQPLFAWENLSKGSRYVQESV